ncbi:hypothetical protein [Hydrogenophaga laconesensis]|uniref:Uncharacterized protein n=1 Tax=Hydrogenophaga laconesensis TaxID=1805971 RepID=A0ABU1VIS0_9BURK|nr:hypothetical protein [Hydrogenophaga laconesensis]MDR7097215.1 hypothetical protein [Hydrogenophaga laconesensis]
MAESTNVRADRVFVLNNDAVSRVVNTDVFSTAGARARVETKEILSDGPSAALAGIESGAEKAITTFPSTSGIAGRIVPGAAYVGMASNTPLGRSVTSTNKSASRKCRCPGLRGAVNVGDWPIPVSRDFAFCVCCVVSKSTLCGVKK